MESMDVAGVLQEPRMLTQVSTPDLKYKLNISSFSAFPHPSDCLNYVNANDGKYGRWLIYVRVWVVTERVDIILFYFLLSFCAIINCSFITGA